jgi:hypothetical protein
MVRAQLAYNRAVRKPKSQTSPGTPEATLSHEEQLGGGGSNTPEPPGPGLPGTSPTDPPQGQSSFPSTQSPREQTNQEQPGGGGSNTTEPPGPGLSGTPLTDPPQGQPSSSITQSPRGRPNQEQGIKGNERSSSISQETRGSEAGRSAPTSMIGRPRGDLGIKIVGTEEDHGFRVKHGDGSKDLNKILPLRPDDNDLEDENSLHSQYKGLEDGHTHLHSAKLHQLGRRRVATNLRRSSTPSNESTTAVRTNHHEADTAALLDTRESERVTGQMPAPGRETNTTGNQQARATVMGVSPGLDQIGFPLQGNQHEEEPDPHDFSQAVANFLTGMTPLPQEMETPKSDNMDSVAELERAHQSPGSGSGRSSIDSDNSTKATVGARHPQGNESNGSRRARESSPDALERFYHHLNEVKVEDEPILSQQAVSNPRSLAIAEAALQSLIRAYYSVCIRANDLNSTISQSEKEYKSLKTSHDELDRQIKDSIDEASKMRIEHGKNISHLEGSISAMQRQIDNLEQKYHGRIEELRQKHQSEKESLVGKHQLEVQQLKTDLATSKEEQTFAISKVEEQHHLQIQQLENDLAASKEQTFAISKVEEQHQLQIQQLKNDLAASKEQIRAISKVEEQHQLQIQQLKNDLAASEEEQTKAINKLKEQHQLQVQQLKNDLAESSQEHNRAVSKLREQYHHHLNTNAAVASSQLATVKRNLEKKMVKEQEAHLATKKKHKDKMEEMTKEHEEEKAQAEINFAAAEAELKENFHKREKQLEKQLRDKERLHNEALRIAQESYQRQLDRVNSELSRAEENKAQEIMRIRSKHADEMRHANESSQKQLAFMQGELKEVTDRNAQEIQAIRVEQAEAMHLVQEEARSSLEDVRSQLKRMKEAKATEIRDLKGQHASSMRRAHENSQQELGRMQAQLRQLSITKDEEITTIIHEYEAKITAMKEAHDADLTKFTKAQQETIDSLQGALVRRDHFKAISDREVAFRFHKISSDLDDFSRVQWEKFWGSSWPFSEQSLRLTANGNERRAKQHLMQNTLWVILYEKVFCTPFRVLGSEGKSLERQWIEKFGDGELLVHTQLVIN